MRPIHRREEGCWRTLSDWGAAATTQHGRELSSPWLVQPYSPSTSAMSASSRGTASQPQIYHVLGPKGQC